MIITLDGPAASGKSSIARLLAQHLGFYYINTGFLYRALTYCLLHDKKYTDQTIANPSLNDVVDCLSPKHLIYAYDNQEVQIYFNNVNITTLLKNALIDDYVCLISPHKEIREQLSHLQRTIAQTHDSVAEGRDVGSVVFPHANHKFYITADIKIRAQRWQKDQEKKGNNYTLQKAQNALEYRDNKDQNRLHSPLIIPKNAHIIDTTHLSIEEAVQKIITLIKK